MQVSSKFSFHVTISVFVLGFLLAPCSAQEQKEERSSPHARVSTKGVMKAQEVLKDKGHYDGEVDGLIGPKTRAALKRYQQDQGLSADGRLTRETAEHLGVVKKGEEADPSVGEHFEEAGEAVKKHYGKGGKEMGRGAKEMGKEVKEGEVVEGAKELGKGAGEFGKEVGKGTAKAAKKVGEGVKDAVDGDDKDEKKDKKKP